MAEEGGIDIVDNEGFRVRGEAKLGKKEEKIFSFFFNGGSFWILRGVTNKDFKNVLKES